MTGQTPYALLQRYKNVPTDRLKEMLAIGEAGMPTWSKRSKAYREAMLQMAHMREELRIREAKP